MSEELRKVEVLLLSHFGDLKVEPGKKIATVIPTWIEVVIDSKNLIVEARFLEELKGEYRDEIIKRAEALKGLEFERVIRQSHTDKYYYVLA